MPALGALKAFRHVPLTKQSIFGVVFAACFIASRFNAVYV